MKQNLTSTSKITWCPGCPDAQILVAFRQAVTELTTENKLKLENLVAVAGIGCHGKIAEYMAINTFTSLHGRALPSMTGIKAANPLLTVVGFLGDGDSFSEGMDHLVHAARRNSNITAFIHDNQIFALTTGQATPTSPKGFKGKSTPEGSLEDPLEPLPLMLDLGATFVARSFALDIKRTKEIMKAAISHKGFAFVDIIQPCITFFDTRKYFEERVTWTDSAPATSVEGARAKIQAGNVGDKVPCGIFYQVSKPTFEEQI